MLMLFCWSGRFDQLVAEKETAMKRTLTEREKVLRADEIETYTLQRRQQQIERKRGIRDKERIELAR